MSEQPQSNAQDQQTVADSRSDMDAAGVGSGDATAVTGTASTGTNDAGVDSGVAGSPSIDRGSTDDAGVETGEASTAGAPEAGQNQI